MVEMGTFVAILIGTIVGGAAAGFVEHGAVVLACACVAIALVGRVVSSVRACNRRAAARPANQLESDQRDLAQPALARENRTVFLSLLGISWLWFVGATFLSSFFSFAKDVLSANPDVVTVLLGTFSIGIGLGSLLCEKLSKRRVEIGLVPLGSIGMSVFAIDLFFASHALPPAGHLLSVGEFLAMPAHWRVLADLFLLAMFGGLYSVPLYALIQSRSQPTPPRAHHRREQYSQLAVHDRVGVDGHGADFGGRQHSGAFPRHRAAEHRGGDVYLLAGA